MPRESVLLESFDGGFNYTTDPQDIKLNEIVGGYNIEPPFFEHGTLRGIRGDYSVATSSTAWGYMRGCGFLTRGDGTRDLIYTTMYNSTVNGFLSYDDLTNREHVVLGSPYKITDGIPTNSVPVFISSGKALRIGAGPLQDTMWVGYPTATNMGASLSGFPVMGKDACEPSGKYPYFSKVVYASDGTSNYLYGIEENGDTVYKVDLSTKTVIAKTEPGDLKRVTALTVGTTGASGWLLVVDNDGSYGTLHQVGLTHDSNGNLGLDYSWAIGSHTKNAGATITDLEWTSDSRSGAAPKGDVWLLYTTPDAYGADQEGGGLPFGPKTKVLWKAAVPSSGTAITITDVTPKLECTFVAYMSNMSTLGEYYSYEAFYSGTNTYSIIGRFFKQGLVRLSTTQIGFCFRLFLRSRTQGTQTYLGPFFKTAASTPVFVGGSSVMMYVHNSWTGTGTKTGIAQIRDGIDVYGTQVHYYDTSDALWMTVGNRLSRYTLTDANIGAFNATGELYDVRISSTQTWETSKYVLGSMTVGGTYLYVGRGTRGGGEGEFARHGVSRNGLVALENGAWAIGEDPDDDDWANWNSVGLAISNNTALTSFPKDITLYFRIALEYDGFQISPLSAVLDTHDTDNTYGYAPKIDITISDVSTFSPRVSAIYLFKAYGDQNASEPKTAYRVVTRIPIDSSRWHMTSAGTPPVTTATMTYYEDILDHGQLFEALSGFPETMRTTSVNYGVAVEAHSYLFVANGNVEGLEEANTYIFRSKPYRYSTFDWSTDYIKMPEKIVALAYFGNRLYAFSNLDCWVIDPNSLIIEEKIASVGAHWQHSVKITPYGLFVASTTHIWHTDGTRWQRISDKIVQNLRSGNLQRFPYTSSVYAGTFTSPILVYDYGNNVLIVSPVTNTVGDTSYNHLLYHPPTASWWAYYDASAHKPFWLYEDQTGVFGVHYYGGSPSWYIRLMGNRKGWVYISKLFTNGNRATKWYKVKILGTDTETVEYAINSSTTFAALTSDAETGIENYLVPDANKIAKQFWIKITDTDGTGEVDSIEILYRPMIGKR